jgi:hypothetical protein
VVSALFVLLIVALVAGAGASISQRLAILIFAALIALFIDIQFDQATIAVLFAVFALSIAVLSMLRAHAASIISLMGVTMLLSTPLASATRPARATAVESTADLPVTIHLLLDEHIGIEGLPHNSTANNLSREIRSFFDQHGFLLFGGSYSEYSLTMTSVSHLLNLVPGAHTPGLYGVGTDGFRWELKRNRYFEILNQRGHALHVYQSDHLDLCPRHFPRVECYTYGAADIHALENASLTVSDKSRVIAAVYFSRSNVKDELKSLYRKVRQRVSRGPITLPAWGWDHDAFSPIGTMWTIDRLIGDISNARRGDYFFAHLLMPHYPYVYDKDCRLRPVKEWLHRLDTDAPAGTRNTPKGRLERYAKYGEQTQCLYRRIEAIVGAIPRELLPDATIIIHGDHGSRITLVDPGASAAARLSPSDYKDAYSTLFAVRSSELKKGYDGRPVSIACLLKTMTESDHRSFDALGNCRTTPVVFFAGGDGEMIAEQLPAYGFGRE